MREREKCVNCRFYDGQREPEKCGGWLHAECHRYPPTMSEHTTQGYPSTVGFGWCGEFVQRGVDDE